jgi:hypothetical protein
MAQNAVQSPVARQPVVSVHKCQENEILQLWWPRDVQGRLLVVKAWFGHLTCRSMRTEVTEKVGDALHKAKGGVLVLSASVSEFGDPAPGCPKQLYVECEFSWLEGKALDAYAFLADRATRHADSDGSSEVEKLRLSLAAPIGPMLVVAVQQ